ncbi:MAG TPA: molybdenum ABC transporter ATP-binding protein [Desulfobulbaceae bacterium]|nr:molybdenum ABC transporter ATP-binding protein [Desulfobulbaceae bacterium]
MLLEVSAEKRFGNFLLDAEFALDCKRCGIFGPSGSGKSTLVHMLAGLLKPDRGKISIAGTPVFDAARGINIPPEKRRVGLVFQHSHLFPNMSVQANLYYGWRRTRKSDRKIGPGALTTALNLDHLLKRDVNSLSGGERRRVAVGRTLLACPRLILLDEPLTGLDAELKSQIMPYLKKVFTEFDVPMLFISHSLQEMRLMTDEVLIPENGCCRKRMSTEELARSSMTSVPRSYVNLLTLRRPQAHNDIWIYSWGDEKLRLIEPGEPGDNLFELGASDITLFKRHPEATSARNILPCKVVEIFGSGGRVGVELEGGGGRLVSQIVHESVRELDIQNGSELFAVIKASAFRKIC